MNEQITIVKEESLMLNTFDLINNAHEFYIGYLHNLFFHSNIQDIGEIEMNKIHEMRMEIAIKAAEDYDKGELVYVFTILEAISGKAFNGVNLNDNNEIEFIFKDF